MDTEHSNQAPPPKKKPQKNQKTPRESRELKKKRDLVHRQGNHLLL